LTGSQNSTTPNRRIVERSETIAATAQCAEASSVKCRKTSAGILGSRPLNSTSRFPYRATERRSLRPNPSSFQTTLPFSPTPLTYVRRIIVVELRDSRSLTAIVSLVIAQVVEIAGSQLLLALRILVRASPGSQPPQGEA
jgi:hypothetical protein